MKRKGLICVILVLTLCVCGCGISELKDYDVKDDIVKENDVEDKEFVIDYYNISITTDYTWSDTERTNWDLQLTNTNSYISIMAYYEIDLAEGQTAIDIYEWQNDDVLNKRENVKVIEPLEVIDTDDKKFTTTLYSAENDGMKNYYYSILVEFDEHEDVFAWVLITASPSYFAKNKENYLDIINTMKYMSESSSVSYLIEQSSGECG